MSSECVLSVKNSSEVEAAFLEAPPEEVAEILDGQLYTSPRPASRHARASSRLGGALDGPFDRGQGGPGGWIFLDEPELHLGPRPDRLVPDLAAWRRSRMPELPDVAAFTLAPDWVCDVLSERTEAIDRGRKMRIYAREGVAHAWLVSPTQRMLEVYLLEAGRWVQIEVFEGDARVRAEPFEAIELGLGALWER